MTMILGHDEYSLGTNSCLATRSYKYCLQKFLEVAKGCSNLQPQVVDSAGFGLVVLGHQVGVVAVPDCRPC